MKASQTGYLQIQNHVANRANNSSFHQTGEAAEGSGVKESRKIKHVPDELVRNISWKMTSLQSEGHVPV